MLDAPPAIVENWAGDLVVHRTDRLRYVSAASWAVVNPTTGAIRLPHLTLDGEPATASYVDSPTNPSLWHEIRWERADPRSPTRRMAETSVAYRMDLRGELRLTHGMGATLYACTFGPYRCETIHWAGPADFNVDGSVDAFDWLAFQNAWTEGSMACDFDRDGGLSVFDFLAYLNQFDAATPRGAE